MQRIYDTAIGQITVNIHCGKHPQVSLSGGDIPKLIKSLGFTINAYRRNPPRVSAIGFDVPGRKELSVFVNGITDRGLSKDEQKQIYDHVWAVILPLFHSIINDKALLLTAEIEYYEQFTPENYEFDIARQRKIIAAAEQEIERIEQERDDHFRKWLDASRRLHGLNEDKEN